MSKNNFRRPVLAAFGGVLMLSAAGMAAAFAGPDYRATLSGSNVPGGGGDRDGWGRVRFEINQSTHRLCADLEVRSIAEVTSAQIYRGHEGQVGDPVARLERPRDDDSYDCKQIGVALAQEIMADPAGFYVAVNTTEYPNGAIRGQINPAG